MKKAGVLCLVLLFSIAGCGPSARPELKQKVNSMFGAQVSTNFGASKKITSIMPYAVGQYVVHGITEKSGKKSVSKMSIVGKESDGWIFEFYSVSESQESTVQMLITGFGKAAREVKPEALEIKWIKIKDEKGQVQTFEGPLLSMMKSMYKSSLSQLQASVKSTYTDGGTITVPAGVFTQTLCFESETTILGKKIKTRSYIHSSVPINGLVRSVGESEGVTTVLLSFGTSGAVSTL